MNEKRVQTTASSSLHAFGLELDFEEPPPGAWEPSFGGGPRLQIRSATAKEIAEHWSGLREIGWQGVIDGLPFVAEVGCAGDHRFVHGQRTVHHLSADASLLRCAPEDPVHTTWWRLVLDSVLFSVALHLGREALHAAAVASQQGAIAITAGTGGGKSTLLAELLRGGLPMLADDVVVLEDRTDVAPLAHPGPPLMNLPSGIAHPPGAVIAPVGEERWIAVHAHPQPLPLAALVVLNRSAGLDLGMHRVHEPLALLLGTLFGFPFTSERERARFELASTIANRVAIWELSADPSVPPDELAEQLRNVLEL